MNKYERIRAVINQEKVDRIPYSFWTHLPGYDLHPEELAQKTYEFYKELDLDFIKTMPNGMFAIEDFGCVCDYSDVLKGGVAKVTKYLVEEESDWEKLQPVDVTKGAYGRELHAVNLLLSKTKNEVPVIATEFSPLTVLSKLSSGKVFTHMKTNPDQIKKCLEIVTDVIIEHANLCIEAGCSGIFLASQVATYDKLTIEEYKEFELPFVKKLISGLSNKAWFNVSHFHGENIIYDVLGEMGLNAISYHVWETDPDPIMHYQKNPQVAILGGIQRSNITTDNRNALEEDIRKIKEQSNGKNLIIAPGCVIRYPINVDTIKFCIDLIKK